MIQYKLQNLIFPHEGRVAEHWRLFTLKSRLLFDTDEKCSLVKKERISFATYFNGISQTKWREYTTIDNIGLSITLRGHVTIKLLGYDLFGTEKVSEKVLKIESYNLKDKTTINLDYSESEHSFLAFEIEVLGDDCRIYEGNYFSNIEPTCVRDVRLALVSVTFKKEDFITSNIKKLEKEIFDHDTALSESLKMLVIDNGRTLDAQSLTTDNIKVIPNKNVGGAGGFTRGMIEANASDFKPTHILLMDDDVEILPESIKRTYNLLSLMNEEYKDAFISGAMLYYEEMNIQHEDVGFVNFEGTHGPSKEKYYLQELSHVLRNDSYIPEQMNKYAGWWYCCFPADIASSDNLPLPLFIRGDDVEYSLRNAKNFMTMSGICIWHMGFTNKFNGSMELYQVHRNSLMLQAISGVLENVDVIGRIKKHFRMEILRFNYNAADLLLDSVEDYLKGPEFLMQDRGEEIMKSQSSKNETLTDLSNYPHIPVDIHRVYEYKERSKLQEFVYKVTFNGHLLPSFMLKKDPGIVAFDWFYCPQHQYLRRTVLAVNPHMKTGAIRTMDKGRFFQLLKRYRSIMRRYNKKRDRLNKTYRAAKTELTSLGFWKKYLEI